MNYKKRKQEAREKERKKERERREKRMNSIFKRGLKIYIVVLFTSERCIKKKITQIILNK